LHAATNFAADFGAFLVYSGKAMRDKKIRTSVQMGLPVSPRGCAD